MPQFDPSDLIDLVKYPIDRRESVEYEELVALTRAELNERGCSVLPAFTPARSIGDLVAEAESVAEKGHRSFNQTNPYFTRDDPSLPNSHPIRRFYPRSNIFVPADNFGTDSLLRAIYERPDFAAFVQDALTETAFHRYADPLADVIVNVVEDGNGFPWHFDTNNFTVTLALQNGLAGGEFQYSPNLRTPTWENYGGVQSVLDGGADGVETLRLQPGDLQIFRGRYSLHRVTPVEGQRKRYVAIFSFVEEANMVGSPERTRQLYGRILPIHLERAGQRRDNLLD
jgi:hypothetical protein